MLAAGMCSDATHKDRKKNHTSQRGSDQPGAAAPVLLSQEAPIDARSQLAALFGDPKGYNFCRR